MSRLRNALLLLGCLLACQAARGADSLFPSNLQIDGLALKQVGEYRYVYRLFFPLYEAALFAKHPSTPQSIQNAETPFHLTFRYLREIDKSIILKSADRMLEKNLSPEERAKIADRVAAINEVYTSVREGDTSSLTFQPEQGTTLRINGEARITLPGEDFARLYFRIWLGERALSADLRDHLLGYK